MSKRTGPLALTALIATSLLASLNSRGQTPEQQQLWDAQRTQLAAETKVKQEQMAKERAARRADPMAWVRTLNPMTAGGWEFRAVAGDGSWAAYSTVHQMTHSGHTVTVWLRQEYAEPQTGGSSGSTAGGNARYQSVVIKAQYDCTKEQTRRYW